MIQISEVRFNEALAELMRQKELPKFIDNVQKNIDAYINLGIVSYKVKDKKGKFIDKVYNLKGTSLLSYLENIQKIKELVCKKPSELVSFQKDIDLIKIICDKEIMEQFNVDLKKILNYTELRKVILPAFYNLLGIKVCIYCNAQHTIFLKNSEIGRYQADHNLSSSKFTHFAITLANLYPTCNNCNHLKNAKDFDFRMYFNNPSEKVDYKIFIEEEHIIKFVKSSFNEAELHIQFKGVSKDFNSTIRPEEIYANHVDYAGDLIKKKIMYTQVYKDGLTTKFAKLFPSVDKKTHDKQLFDRLLYGSSLVEKDIHKRVFSKLTIDIMEQLEKLSPDKLKYD